MYGLNSPETPSTVLFATPVPIWYRWSFFVLRIIPIPNEFTQSSLLIAPLIPKNNWFLIGGGSGAGSLTILGLIVADHFLEAILFSDTV